MSVQRFRIALEPFAYRHFQPDFAGRNSISFVKRIVYIHYIGTKITIPVSQFVSKINEYYETSAKAAEASSNRKSVGEYNVTSVAIL